MSNLALDLRHSFRSLSQRPRFFLLVVATLALGIGACTAIFSAINALVFRALPYDEADKLVFIWSGDPRKGNEGIVVSYPDFLDWKKDNRSFQDAAAFNVASGHLTGATEPEEVWGAQVTPNFFSVLGVKPMIGGGFSGSEPSEQQEILLSHGLWRRRFGGDPALIGTTITLSGKPYVVVGILPPGIRHPEPFWQREPDFWRPLQYNPEWMTRGSRFLRVIARLMRDRSLASAQTDMDGITRRQETLFPDTNRDRRAVVVPLREQLFGDLRRPLLILLGTAGFVLMIACANVGNLLLTRSLARQQEFAVRAALGARPAQIARGYLAEGLVVSLIGGALGIILALWGTKALVALSPAEIPGLRQAALDGRVLLFALLVTLFATLAAGVLPALRLLHPDLSSNLGVAGRTSSRRTSRVRGLLAVSQIAFALPLLIAAGLLAKSALDLNRVELGFRRGEELTFRLSLPSRRYPEPYSILSFYSAVRREIAALPGVRSVAFASSIPLSGLNDQTRDFFVEGSPVSHDLPSAHYRVVTSEYFNTLGIPVLEGEPLPAESAPGRPVAAVSRTFAARFWPGDTAVGKKIRLGGDTSAPWTEIVSVVGDVRDGQVAAEPGSMIYVPQAQDPVSGMYVVVHTAGNPESLIRPIQKIVWSLDPELPTTDLRTMEQIVWSSNMAPRFYALSTTALAFLAISLALIGVFGVVAYRAGERAREFGVRAALGAGRRELFLLVLRYTGILTTAGLITGLGLALLLTRLLANLLYRISSTEPLAFAAAAALLSGAILLASLVPAWQAATTDPTILLREE